MYSAKLKPAFQSILIKVAPVLRVLFCNFNSDSGAAPCQFKPAAIFDSSCLSAGLHPCRITDWGEESDHVKAAQEELVHFEKTGEFIEAIYHQWCKACGVDEYGVGFDLDEED